MQSCATTPTCVYNTAMGFCDSAPCVATPNEDACIADSAGCTFDPLAPTQCEATQCVSSTTERDCERNPQGCMWSSLGTCVKNYCNTTDPKVCSAYLQCQWSNGACQITTCGSLVTEQVCQADRDCSWDVSMAPPGCYVAPCRNYSTSSSCVAYPSCFWQTIAMNGFKDMCVEKTCDVNLRDVDLRRNGRLRMAEPELQRQQLHPVPSHRSGFPFGGHHGDDFGVSTTSEWVLGDCGSDSKLEPFRAAVTIDFAEWI